MTESSDGPATTPRPGSIDDSKTNPFSPGGLLTGLGGVLLLVGSFLPWVTIGVFLSISGVDARWGLVTLFGGLALLAISGQIITERLVPPSHTRLAASVGVAIGALCLGVALYVSLALRDSLAEAEGAPDSTDGGELGGEFAEALDALFAVGTGAGLYTVGLGAILAAVGAGLALRRTE